MNAARGVDLTVETAGIVQDVHFRPMSTSRPARSCSSSTTPIEQADLEAAKTQAALDQQTLERAIELQKRGVGSTVTLDAAQAAASASAAQVDKLEAVLDQKTAPSAVRRHDRHSASRGRAVPGAGHHRRHAQDLETMRVDFTVPEQQISLIKIGQPVRFGVERGRSALYRHDHRHRSEGRPVDAAGRGPRRDRQSRRQAQPRPVRAGRASSCRRRTASSPCRRPRS